MITSKWFIFIIAKIYNILQYVIPHVPRHMYNLHIKETEICQKRSKGNKKLKDNWGVVYIFITATTDTQNDISKQNWLRLTVGRA